LVGSFAVAIIASAVTGVLATDGREVLPMVLAICLIPIGLFGVCSVGILFRHRAIALRWVALTGAVLGIFAYATTWGLWVVTDPGFRHAVPFDLIPVVLSFLSGIGCSAIYYLASLEAST
jgi:hypothetical protein